MALTQADLDGIKGVVEAVVEPRFAAVDRQLVQVRQDIENLAASTAEQFLVIDARFAAMDARFEAVDARFDAMDARFDAMDARFDAMDLRFDGVDAEIADVKAVVSDHGYRVTRLERKAGRA
ncbi:MAG TPA: hypothetical protein VI322_03380 [Candidatus Saccharimonadia bacterium]